MSLPPGFRNSNCPKIHLNDGNWLPQIGFGCYQLSNTVQSVSEAIRCGYRLIDSARVYKNEADVGEAVREAMSESLLREDIFVTTKINARSHGTRDSAKAIRQSLSRFGLSQIDLYLLHDAISGKERRLQAWCSLLQAQLEGRIRSIGVSNWNANHLEELRLQGLELPAVNQLEIHPFCQQQEITEYCRAHRIAVQAYCPLVRGQRFDDETIMDISKQTNRTAAQVLLRWSVQRGYVPLVKTTSAARMRNIRYLNVLGIQLSGSTEENMDIWDFELSGEQMERLDSLDEGAAGACSWNPVDCV